MSHAASQTFSDHLYELWRRLAFCLLVLIAGGVFGYIERQFIISKFEAPLHMPLYYTSPSGAFEFIMQVSVVIGVFFALPVFVYNLLRFIEPAFSSRRISRRKMLLLIVSSLALAAGGVVFAYTIILPMSFHFFSGFNNGLFKPLISINEYFSFAMSCLISFAIIFQLPLVMLFINSIRRFPPGKLRRYRRHVIVGSFVLALVLPFTYDPLTQFVMALPIVLLFELSLLLVWFVNWRAKSRAAPAKAPAPEAAPASVRPIPLRPVLPTPLSYNNAPSQSQPAAASTYPQLGRYRSPAPVFNSRLLQL